MPSNQNAFPVISEKGIELSLLVPESGDYPLYAMADGTTNRAFNTLSITGSTITLSADGALLNSFVSDAPYRIPINAAGSVAWSMPDNLPTVDTVITIKKGNTSIGTITYHAGFGTFTYAFAVEVSFNTVDVLSFVMQTPADATWIGGWTIKGIYL